MRCTQGLIGLAMVLLAAGAVQAAITIETVTVGDPGNAADTGYETPGCGASVAGGGPEQEYRSFA